MPTAQTPENGFAAVLARAIRDSRLSLPQIQNQLKRQGVQLDLATLTYWRSGSALPTQDPDLKAVAALEDLLGLGVGQLSLRLPEDGLGRRHLRRVPARAGRAGGAAAATWPSPSRPATGGTWCT